MNDFYAFVQAFNIQICFCTCKAITVKCFVSHRLVSSDGGSVSRTKKKNDHLKGSGFQRRLDCKVRNLVTNSTGKRGPAFRLLFLICCKIYSQMVKDVY